MKPRTMLVVSGVVFTVIAVGHLIRVLLRSEVVLEGWQVPQAVSVLAVVIAGVIAGLNFAAARRA